jgi:serine protease Do
MPAGIYITALEEASDAAAKGIEPGDILISMDGIRLSDMDALKSALLGYEIGDSVTVIIYRGGRQYSVTLTLHESTN